MRLDKKILGAVAASMIGAAVSTDANAKDCGNDYDLDNATQYRAPGDISCTASAIPAELTGTFGLVADQCQLTIKTTTDGNNFSSDKRPDIEAAIASINGNSLDGRYLVPGGINASNGDLIVNDALDSSGLGDSYILHGVDTGSITATELQGFSNGGVSLDDNGRAFMPDGDDIYEIFPGSAPSLYYENGDSVYGVKVDTTTGEMMISDASGITHVTGLSNSYPHNSAASLAMANNGVTYAFNPAVNGTAVISADDYLQYCDNGVALDTTPPDLISAQGVSGEGYFPEVIDLNDNPVVNCNDKEFVAVLAFNEDVTNVSASNTFGSITAGVVVNGSTVIIPGDVNQYNVGTVDLHVDMEDLAGNPASYDGSYEVRCDDVPPAGYIEGNGDTYAIPGESENGRVTLPDGVVAELGNGTIDFSGDSEPGVLAEIQDILNDLVATLENGAGELTIQGDPNSDFNIGIVFGVGARTSAVDTDCPSFMCIVAEANNGTTVSGSYVDLNTGERVPFTDQTKVLVSQNATEGPGTGTGTGTGGETGTGTGSTKPGTAGNGGVEKTGCDTTGGSTGGWAAVGLLGLLGMRRKEDE